MNARDFFAGRRLVIATKHGKETLIGPKVASQLGVLPFVCLELDTDLLGTFSGEVERKEGPLATARKKCELAMSYSGVDLAIASEGSFGAHPTYYFLPGNEELIMLLDKRQGLEIVGRKLSAETNFGSRYCKTEAELLEFAREAHFPSHGLILRERRGAIDTVCKGICEQQELLATFRMFLARSGQAFVETDMRALYNPMRMKVIGEATDELLKRVLVQCEKCNSPGFGIRGVQPGMPCSLCGRPTRSPQARVYGCVKCGFSKTEKICDKDAEDPMYCDYCNP
ncbi:DUF6671 family protein [Cyclobacterium xiamenense]|uniref:DUF6671 family protein n=1 Tax=Cyclobacterium xiamenense TaxID=1297121 RepID=UPI0012B8C686|nr:DUF6671 family protein [Cyclobacterium xiamenense]